MSTPKWSILTSFAGELLDEMLAVDSRPFSLRLGALQRQLERTGNSSNFSYGEGIEPPSV